MSDEQRTRGRPSQRLTTGGADSGSGPDLPDLGQIRERAERLRSLGSGIIQNALSGNSERFLEHSRQRGGQ